VAWHASKVYCPCYQVARTGFKTASPMKAPTPVPLPIAHCSGIELLLLYDIFGFLLVVTLKVLVFLMSSEGSPLDTDDF
jgi:hypothetical protein